MKNIKLFGACAAVALFSACSSEEDIATAEGLVPEGMKKVSVTINEQLFADETGKKRVSMDKNGNFTWNHDASIAVVYEGLGKTQIYRFSGDNSVINDGVTGNFKGEIPFDVWLNMTPTHVYSEHTGNLTNTASVDEYTQVKTNQENAEDLWNGSGAICIDRPTENYSDFKYDLHLHGVPDFSDGSCVGDKQVSVFQATLSLDVAAFVHIDMDDLPGADNQSGWFYRITVKGQNCEEQEYVISCKDENMEETEDHRYAFPKDGLSFFVKVPVGGIVNPQITVRGEEGFNEPITFTTKGGKTLEGAKRYKLENPNATKGTAIARIGDNDVKVQWVQLWAGGPKFATYNVGATRVGEAGDDWIFYSDAAKTGADYVWGANWRTPRMDELENLVFDDHYIRNSGENDNVRFTSGWRDGIYGWIFTGKQTGYTENELFLPTNWIDDSDSSALYHTSTPGGFGSYMLSLQNEKNFSDGSHDIYSIITSGDQNTSCFLRPVLAE